MTLMSAEKLAEDLTHGELLAELRYLRVEVDYLKSSDSTQEKAKIIYELRAFHALRYLLTVSGMARRTRHCLPSGSPKTT
ncbi:hypothetical protein LZ075_003085 [Salmonella enterica subsp. enterica serovar Javiana]|nr:hypothetical protein [Salmonella enterica subsp. enterica serovar Javiana]EBV2938571.1 hypothetical protein [Salmonella enterica subsp. enterica serovar Javiana]EIS5021091.1 hypothetical protein [Salmonella enterica subsp. enterica serovar Javiana]EIU1171314.1 hypothetical protein [Salmonella enterica subsp. enterica serovar Javiana]